MPTQRLLAAEVSELLDGRNLESRVGQTFVLASAGTDSWPHIALLSVGEVLATSPSRLLLAMYSGSGTTAGLRSSGRGLLLAVVEGVTYKISFACEELPQGAPPRSGLTAFGAEVERCVTDEVPYARVLHGIEYALADHGAVVKRWHDQLAWLASFAEPPFSL